MMVPCYVLKEYLVHVLIVDITEQPLILTERLNVIAVKDGLGTLKDGCNLPLLISSFLIDNATMATDSSQQCQKSLG